MGSRLAATGPGHVSRQAHGRQVLLGFALAGFGMLIIPVGDAIAKHLTGIDYHVLQIAWGRWVSHLVILTPVAPGADETR